MDLLDKPSCSLNHSTCFRTVSTENAVVEGGETTEYIEHLIILITQTYNLDKLLNMIVYT